MAGLTWTQRRTLVHTSVVCSAQRRRHHLVRRPARGSRGPVTDGVTWTTCRHRFPCRRGPRGVGRTTRQSQCAVCIDCDHWRGVHSVRRLNGAGKLLNGLRSPRHAAGQPGRLRSRNIGGPQQFEPHLSRWRPRRQCRLHLAMSSVTEWVGIFNDRGIDRRNAHADVHVVMHAPGDSNTLWQVPTAGYSSIRSCRHRHFRGAAIPVWRPSAPTSFRSIPRACCAVCRTPGQRNHAIHRGRGLASCSVRDGGYCVVNWNNSFKYCSAQCQRLSSNRWRPGLRIEPIQPGLLDTVTPPLFSKVMAAPLVRATNQYRRSGGGRGGGVGGWPASVHLLRLRHIVAGCGEPPGGFRSGFSMIFASAIRIFAGTTTGRIFRLDKGASWVATRIDNAAAGALPLTGLVTDIASIPLTRRSTPSL